MCKGVHRQRGPAFGARERFTSRFIPDEAVLTARAPVPYGGAVRTPTPPGRTSTDNLMLTSPDLLRELDYASRVVRALRKSPPSAPRA